MRRILNFTTRKPCSLSSSFSGPTISSTPQRNSARPSETFFLNLNALIGARGKLPTLILERAMDAMLRGSGISARAKVEDGSQQPEVTMAKRANLLTWQAERPMAGWNAWESGFSNPRVPSVPATLELTLEEYYAAAALMGLLAAQRKEPDIAWAKRLVDENGRGDGR